MSTASAHGIRSGPRTDSWRQHVVMCHAGLPAAALESVCLLFVWLILQTMGFNIRHQQGQICSMLNPMPICKRTRSGVIDKVIA